MAANVQFPQEIAFNTFNLRSFQMEVMLNNSRLEWFRDQINTINGIYHPVFTTMPTFRGMGYTFNLLDADELFDFKL